MNIDIINEYLKHTRGFSNIAHMAIKIALSIYTAKIKTSECDFETEFDIIVAKITNNLIDYHDNCIDFREILAPFNIYYNLPYTKISLYKDFIEDYGANGLKYTDIYMSDSGIANFIKKYNNNKDKLISLYKYLHNLNVAVKNKNIDIDKINKNDETEIDIYRDFLKTFIFDNNEITHDIFNNHIVQFKKMITDIYHYNEMREEKICFESHIERFYYHDLVEKNNKEYKRYQDYCESNTCDPPQKPFYFIVD